MVEKKVSKEKITKDMTLGDLVSKYPKAAEIMMKRGMHCCGCHVAAFETVEQGSLAHGMKKKDMEEMIKDMNKAVK